MLFRSLTAIRHCERHGKVWRWNKGAKYYECLDANKSANLVAQYRSDVHKKSKRTLRIASTVDRKSIKDSDRLKEFDLTVLQVAMAKTSTGLEVKKLLNAKDAVNKFAEPNPSALVDLFG